MNQSNEDFRFRIAELESENARLKAALELVKSQRKELTERLYGPVRETDIPTEAELLNMMKDRIDGRKAFEELGILPAMPSRT